MAFPLEAFHLFGFRWLSYFLEVSVFTFVFFARKWEQSGTIHKVILKDLKSLR